MPRFAMREHVRQQRVHTIGHAGEIDNGRPRPIRLVAVDHRSEQADARIKTQDMEPAVALLDSLTRPLPIVAIADVERKEQRAIPRLGERFAGGLEMIRPDVRDNHEQP